MTHNPCPTVLHTVVLCPIPPLTYVLALQRPPALASKTPESWTVDEVAQFIEGIPGCADQARKFRIHLIDGEAMLYLNMRHLVRIMEIKLGPALKIYSVISQLRKSPQCCNQVSDT